MCEHVALSRAELFAAVQVSELRTFSEIITRFGTGRGCDICKPVVASVLASIYDEHVLAADRAALQDTNDRVMASSCRRSGRGSWPAGWSRATPTGRHCVR